MSLELGAACSVTMITNHIAGLTFNDAPGSYIQYTRTLAPHASLQVIESCQHYANWLLETCAT